MARPKKRELTISSHTPRKKLKFSEDITTDNEPKTPENNKTDTYTCPKTVTVAEFLANFVEPPEDTPMKPRSLFVAEEKAEEEEECDATEEAQKEECDLTEEVLKEEEVSSLGESAVLALDFDHI